MDPGTAKALMLLPTDKSDAKIIKAYQTYVGGLIWLLKTRPDLYFTISLLSRFLQCATASHLKLALSRPLRFLKKTVDYGLVFLTGNEKWVLSGSSDSDLAGDLNSARSTMGHYAKLGRYGTVIASCGLERKICTSTGQAETFAMRSLINNIECLRELLAELGFPMQDPTYLAVDNAGVLKQSTKAVNHTAAKHYRTALAYIRQKVRELLVALWKVESDKNGSDIFTKALHAPLFVRHQEAILGPQSFPVEE